MIQEVVNYQKVLDRLPVLLEETHFKSKYIIEELGITKPTFYRKLKNGSWTPNEVIQLAKYIEPEQYYRYQFEQEALVAEGELEKGELISNELALKTIKDRIKK